MKTDTNDTTDRISNSENTKENTIDTTDRITLLRDSIVHHILSYLVDHPKLRIRMSVLSKRWFALTASFPILYFHLNAAWFWSFSREHDPKYIREKFYKYVEYTVSRFCEQNISAQTLEIYAEITNLERRELFGRCLDLVLEKGLQTMDIHFWYDFNTANQPMLRLPNAVLSASSLTSLTLNKCELPSSLMVGVVKFKSLRLLSLSYIPIDEGVIEYLTKCCPLLEEIYLGYCYGFKRFCVKRHHNLLKVGINLLEVDYYRDERVLLERIDIEAPNLSYFLLSSNKDKAPSINMASCKKLTTFCYCGFPLKRFSDYLSNFPILENVSLNLSSGVDNLKLSHQFLRKLVLQSDCDLEKIDLNAPNLLLFEYYDRTYFQNFKILSREDSSLSKGCMTCLAIEYSGNLWFEKLRKFLDKNSIFKVLKLRLPIVLQTHVAELQLMESPPYELEHVELTGTPVSVALIDAVLWCCRPRSLSLELYRYNGNCVVAEYAYEKLLRQEDEGQTNIKFVLSPSYKDEQPFSDLDSLLNALCREESRCKITFIKEEVVQEAG